MRKHEQSEIQRLAEEKAKRAAKKETGKVVLMIMTPLSILATIAALHIPGFQGQGLLLSLFLLVVFLLLTFAVNDTLYQKYYKMYLEEGPSKKEEE